MFLKQNKSFIDLNIIIIIYCVCSVNKRRQNQLIINVFNINFKAVIKFLIIDK